MQRTRDNVSGQPFAGRTTASGDVVATVRLDGVIVPGFEGACVGRADGAAFRGEIAGLPIGGPYEIDIEVAGSGFSLEFADILVGDVWIMAGQSNMEGVGAMTQALAPDPMVHAFYMDDRWDVAKDPVNDMSLAIDPVHSDLRGGQPMPLVTRGVSPGPAFGQEMFRLTGLPQGLIACAHGGTSMNQWSPELKSQGDRSLYGATLRRIAKNGGRVAGVLWYQGCSDANPTDSGEVYTKRMQALVAAFREDLNAPTLPFATVQIGTFATSEASVEGWMGVRDRQQALPFVIPNLTVSTAIDLPLDDNIHLSGEAQNRLGRRMARAMNALRGGAGQGPMSLAGLSYAPNELHEGVDLSVRFANVVGALSAPDRPSGFLLLAPGGRVVPPYRIDLSGDTAILRTCTEWADMRGLSLCHGYGFNPYCNITDSDDRGLPAFGPVPVSSAHPSS